MKHLLIPVVLITFFCSHSFAQHKIKESAKKDSMNRIERAKQTYEKLFQRVQSVANSDDPELMTILQRFIFGDVFYTGNLSDTTRELITITALVTNQTFPLQSPLPLKDYWCMTAPAMHFGFIMEQHGKK